MATTDRILDWGTIADAGIDTDRVVCETNPQDTSLEQYRITAVDGATSLLFGEYYDRSEGGWDSLVYERVGSGDELTWEPAGSAPEYYETAAECLADIARWAQAN